jgi:hypothetical protein
MIAMDGSLQRSTPTEALELVEAWARDDGTLPAYLSLAQVESRNGAILGSDTSIAIRPLR